MAGKKLLVADDSLTIQKVIRLALSNEGYEIQAVSDGNDAVQQISLFRPDAVLIDVSLPTKSAFEVKREINEMQDLHEVRFVLMSSAFEKVDEGQAAAVGFHARLTKPFDPAHLRQVLGEVLAQVTAQRMEKTSILTREATREITRETLRDLKAPAPPMSDIPSPGDLAPLPIFEMMPPSSASSSSSADFPPLTEIPSEPMQDWAPPPMEGDADIKKLTESTIKISGLEDFNWSVQEPTLKPEAGFADTGNTSFHLPSDIDGDTFAGGLDLSEPLPGAAVTTAPLQMQQQQGSGNGMLGIGNMEELVRKEVQATLERMTRQMLPDVAERVIKQEIHRLLTEQP